MPIASLYIPQIGEGLQEARVVALLKQPGESIRRDEPVYQMETDKAVMDVESPVDGVLQEWLAPPDSLLPIGAEIARVEVADGVEAPKPHAESAAPTAQRVAESASAAHPRNAHIPPRTRAYGKEKGLTDDELAVIPALGGKLMPSDIDAFLANAPAYSESPMPAAQRLLASRLSRGAHLVVPGTITAAFGWESVEAAKARYQASGGEFQPSAFTLFAHAVAQALAEFPAFRSSLAGDDRIRTYHHAALGIAVARPNDELVLAVVEDADSLGWREFAAKMREKIGLARDGKDQASEAVTLSLTNMQAFGLRDAIPVVVPPAVGTLFLGEVYRALDPASEEIRLRKFANVALTFDHRLINGVGAADFLNAIRKRVETVADWIEPA
jgi:pyruvate dehydrogenase E2 component (dihydrolipoamide acetyltransferase)